jgi:radical SAM superfamily enzyme YgiQ (UPF0313 family)
MLFTKSTESGIQLENALILSPENLNKALIPANNDRIKAWAKDNHVNVAIAPQSDSDFNLVIGVMLDESVSDPTMNASKKMLKHAEKELIEFIEGLPSNVDDAADDAIVANELDKLMKEFAKNVQSITGEEVMESIRIFKLRTPWN